MELTLPDQVNTTNVFLLQMLCKSEWEWLETIPAYDSLGGATSQQFCQAFKLKFKQTDIWLNVAFVLFGPGIHFFVGFEVWPAGII